MILFTESLVGRTESIYENVSKSMKNRGHRCWGWGGTNRMKKTKLYDKSNSTKAPQMSWITKLDKDMDD